MVPVELFALKHDAGKDGEDDEGDDFLYHLELHEGEGTSVAYESNLVGWHLHAVFEERYDPREGDDAEERP